MSCYAQNTKFCKKLGLQAKILFLAGGERGIRTLDPIINEITAFEAAAFDHSAISPHRNIYLFYITGSRYPT